MNEDIFSVIEYKMPAFSKGQKRIAALICESYDKVAFMTASSLGKQAGVSESTVVRFAMELGYQGYPQMQKAMQEMVLNRLTSVERMGSFSTEDQDVLSTVLHSDAERVRKTCETVDRTAFVDAVDTIANARKIYVLGVRSSSAVAGFMGHYLNYMFDEVHIVTDENAVGILEQLVNIGEGDAVIAFSFPRYAAAVIDAVSFCHSAGASVIGVTNSVFSPMAAYCDHILVAQSDMISVVDSLVAPLSLVNALLVALSGAREKQLRVRLEKLENIWQNYHIYEKREDEV